MGRAGWWSCPDGESLRLLGSVSFGRIVDPREHTGWSVIVTGLAGLVRDADEVARYERMLRPWANGDMNQIVRIQPEYITGYRLTRESDGHPVPAQG